MKFEPMVTSLLSTDIYKFNMNSVMFLKHPDLVGEYYFVCRNKNAIFTQEMLKEINDQLDHLCKLRFTEEEIEYLKSIKYLNKGYIEFLKFWYPRKEYVKMNLDEEGHLNVVISGPLYAVMQFEIYLLEIINETYFRCQYDYDTLIKNARIRLEEKLQGFKTGKYNFKFAEFGARRRLSGEWQDELVRKILKEIPNNCVGTSNVYLAKRYNVKPIGTYAHEFVQMYQGISGMQLAYTNHFALKEWFEVFNGDNGTALTDTLSTDLFLLDFDKVQATMYTGVRHDSGDPYQWGEKIIAHYEKLGIDPKTKTLLFSDSLDFDKAQEIYDYFKDRINVSFGIGTYLTNDTGEDPLNIVIKLQYVNGKPVAKLSDNIGKTLCQDATYLAHLKEAVEYRITEGK